MIDASALAVHYSRFRVSDRILLTGHSHQAWPDVGVAAQQRAWLDAAGTPYRLGIDPGTGLPYWVVTPIAGVGISPVTVEDGMGGFLLVFDEDGNVVYA